MVRQVVRHDRSFRWGLEFGTPIRSTSELKFFEEAASFGIRCGFTIPIHDNSGAIAAVSFATDKRRIGFERSIRERPDALQLIARYFHAHVKPKLQLDRLIGGTLLSPRELECLQWSSRGKSAGDIGTILGISQRTVAFHLDNARAKLGVRTIRQAAVLLAEANSRR
ncbi:DNA-binding CsgD family transcriptional regulator [Bradyrhizobium sp. USDA 10063]